MRLLDYRRLGKQRVEAKQILDALAGRSRGWRSHPAVLMWRGHEASLRMYLRCAILEWKRRGYRNTMRLPARGLCSSRKPAWLTPAFIRAHRSNLLRKDPGHYERFGWGVTADLPYVWPVSRRRRDLFGP